MVLVDAQSAPTIPAPGCESAARSTPASTRACRPDTDHVHRQLAFRARGRQRPASVVQTSYDFEKPSTSLAGVRPGKAREL